MKEGRRDARKRVKSLLAGIDQRETATRLRTTFSLRSASCCCEEEVDLSESDWSFTVAVVVVVVDARLGGLSDASLVLENLVLCAGSAGGDLVSAQCAV